MERHWMYPDILSEVEEQLGFERVLINNPDFEFFGHSSIVPAVVLRLGLGDRIAKIADPEGRAEFMHQIFGTYGTGGRLGWNPVLVPFPDPQVAMRSAQSGRDVNDPLAPEIIPAAPAIPLRCSKCSHRFQVASDHLPIGGEQKCPECEAQGANEQFADLNL